MSVLVYENLSLSAEHVTRICAEYVDGLLVGTSVNQLHPDWKLHFQYLSIVVPALAQLCNKRFNIGSTNRQYLSTSKLRCFVQGSHAKGLQLRSLRTRFD